MEPPPHAGDIYTAECSHEGVASSPCGRMVGNLLSRARLLHVLLGIAGRVLSHHLRLVRTSPSPSQCRDFALRARPRDTSLVSPICCHPSPRPPPTFCHHRQPTVQLPFHPKRSLSSPERTHANQGKEPVDPAWIRLCSSAMWSVHVVTNRIHYIVLGQL
jgi:hypothetical protein